MHPKSIINPQSYTEEEHPISFVCSFEFHFDSFVISAKARSFYVCFKLLQVLREMKVEQQVPIHILEQQVPIHILLWLTYFLSILYSINSEWTNRITKKGRRCFPSTCIQVTRFSFKEQVLDFICTTFVYMGIKRFFKAEMFVNTFNKSLWSLQKF